MERGKAKGVFEGAAIDLTDGFIHFSTAKQAAETAARHFSGQVDLLLIAVDGAALGDKLVYEPSRGGDLFPHLYAPLPLTAVLLGNAAFARSRRPAPVPGDFVMSGLFSSIGRKGLFLVDPERRMACPLRR